MLKQGTICEKLLKRQVERKVVASLVAGKLLRSTEIKFEVTESKLSYYIMMSRNTVVSSYPYNHAVIKVIKVLK